jgi:hypothetical protein
LFSRSQPGTASWRHETTIASLYNSEIMKKLVAIIILNQMKILFGIVVLLLLMMLAAMTFIVA